MAGTLPPPPPRALGCGRLRAMNKDAPRFLRCVSCGAVVPWTEGSRGLCPKCGGVLLPVGAGLVDPPDCVS